VLSVGRNSMRWGMRGLARIAAAMIAIVAAGPAQAAELRIEFRELAAIAQQALGGASLRLHNAPASGVLDFSPGSFVSIGSTQVPVSVPVRTFPIAGGTYAYYVNDINSTGVSFEAVPGAVRLTLRFESEAPELFGRCRSGICAPMNALPRIEWSDASVSIDLAPVGLGDSLSLEAKAVKIGGTFAPSCSPSAALISGGICKSVLSKARQAIAKLRGDLDGMLRGQMNKPEIQAKIAGELKKRLVLGPAGELKIRSVSMNDAAVTISFCLACAG
jgi:hypothetical protein